MRVIEIPGKPVGKGRPRFGNGFTYTPQKTVDFENLVKLSYMQAYPGADLLEGPLVAGIHAYFPIPASVSKKKRATMEDTPYPHKADCDNIAKAVLDALNGVAYDDDAQVTSLIVKKSYSERPRTVVKLMNEIATCNSDAGMV